MESQSEGSVTPEDLYDFVTSLGEDRTIRSVENSALLLPVSTVMQLLNLTFTEMWDGARSENSRLPVSKTIRKNFFTDPKFPGRNAFMKLMGALPSLEGIAARLDESFKQDFVWKPGLEWQGIFDSNFFTHDEAKKFWLQFVDDAAEFNAVRLRFTDANRLNTLRIYVKDPLVVRYGCAKMRPALEQWLEENSCREAEGVDRRLGLLLLMDCIAVLMRILAWKVADMQVSQWDSWMSEAEEDVIPLEALLPQRDNSNPFKAGLERLAKHAGWSGGERPNAITFLSSVWAQNDEKGGAEAADQGGRRKQLENWAQLKKGRPTFKLLTRLSESVTHAQPKFSDVDHQTLENYTWCQAVVLRVAETLSMLQRDLLNAGFTGEQIASLGDAYKTEYWIARNTLGKPRSPAATRTAD